MKTDFANKGFFSHGVMNVTPKGAFELCKLGAIIVDVRESYMNRFKMFDVQKVICLSFSELEKTYKQLPDDVYLIFADAAGMRSRESVIFMKEHGYGNILNLAGGIVEWERDGLPVKTDISHRHSGSCMCQLKNREGGKRRRENGEKQK